MYLKELSRKQMIWGIFPSKKQKRAKRAFALREKEVALFKRGQKEFLLLGRNPRALSKEGKKGFCFLLKRCSSFQKRAKRAFAFCSKEVAIFNSAPLLGKKSF